MYSFERQGNSHDLALNMESRERDLFQILKSVNSRESFEDILDTQVRTIVDHDGGNEDQKNRWLALNEFVNDLKKGYTYDQVASRRTSRPEHWFPVPLGPFLAEELAYWYRDNEGNK